MLHRTKMRNIFENATSIVLAIAAHALAVGLVVAL
jgi:flagellar biosynthesis protein FliQ